MVTVASLGGFMFVMFRRDLKLGRGHTCFNRLTDRRTEADIMKASGKTYKGVTMGISPVLWQFLTKWLARLRAVSGREASTIAPYTDALYFFLLAMTLVGTDAGRSP